MKRFVISKLLMTQAVRQVETIDDFTPPDKPVTESYVPDVFDPLEFPEEDRQY